MAINTIVNHNQEIMELQRKIEELTRQVEVGSEISSMRRDENDQLKQERDQLAAQNARWESAVDHIFGTKELSLVELVAPINMIKAQAIEESAIGVEQGDFTGGAFKYSPAEWAEHLRDIAKAVRQLPKGVI